MTSSTSTIKATSSEVEEPSRACSTSIAVVAVAWVAQMKLAGQAKAAGKFEADLQNMQVLEGPGPVVALPAEREYSLD